MHNSYRFISYFHTPFRSQNGTNSPNLFSHWRILCHHSKSNYCSQIRMSLLMESNFIIHIARQWFMFPVFLCVWECRDEENGKRAAPFGAHSLLGACLFPEFNHSSTTFVVYCHLHDGEDGDDRWGKVANIVPCWGTKWKSMAWKIQSPRESTSRFVLSSVFFVPLLFRIELLQAKRHINALHKAGTRLVGSSRLALSVECAKTKIG